MKPAPLSQSIHPRAWRGGPKKNTCAPTSSRHGGAGGKTLRRCQKRLMIRLKAWETLDATSKKGCRRPGSMQP